MAPRIRCPVGFWCFLTLFGALIEKSNKRGARTWVFFFPSIKLLSAVNRLLDSMTERTITDPNICHVNKAALGLLHLLEWLFFKGIKSDKNDNRPCCTAPVKILHDSENTDHRIPFLFSGRLLLWLSYNFPLYWPSTSSTITVLQIQINTTPWIFLKLL